MIPHISGSLRRLFVPALALLITSSMGCGGGTPTSPMGTTPPAPTLPPPAGPPSPVTVYTNPASPELMRIDDANPRVYVGQKNAQGLPVAITRAVGGQSDAQAFVDYDASGRPTRSTLSDGTTSRFEWYPDGRVLFAVFLTNGDALSVVVPTRLASPSQRFGNSEVLPRTGSVIGPATFADDFCESLKENFGRLDAVTHGINEAGMCLLLMKTATYFNPLAAPAIGKVCLEFMATLDIFAFAAEPLSCLGARVYEILAPPAPVAPILPSQPTPVPLPTPPSSPTPTPVTPLPGSFAFTNATPGCGGSGPQVTLNWTAASGANTYDVYRDGSLYSSGIPASTLSFVNSGARVTPGATYSYFIRARNVAGTTDSVPSRQAIAPSNCGGTVSPAPAPPTSQFEGRWAGAGSGRSSGSTPAKVDITFRVTGSRVVDFDFQWTINQTPPAPSFGICPGHGTPGGELPITGNAFRFEGADSVYAVTITGTFNAATTVSGTAIFQRVGSAFPVCPNATLSWSGRKQ